MTNLLQEIRRILASPWQVVLFLVMPPLLTVLFCLLFGAGIIQGTRTVIVDQDQSALSQSLADAFRDSRGFRVLAELTDPAAAWEMVNREEADLVLILPTGFGRDLKKGRGADLLLMVNGANMAIASNAMKKAGEIVLTFNGGIEIQRLQAMGLLPEQAKTIAQPLRLQTRQLNNPSGSFGDFLLWGLIGAIGHFPLMLFAVAALDRKGATGKMLATSGAYALLGSGEILLCLAVACLAAPLTGGGGILPILLLVLVFAMAVTAMALFISTAAPNRVIASQAGTIVVLPALLLSGYTWPMRGFPDSVRFLGHLEPLTYFAEPLRQLMLTGQTGSLYWRGVAMLLLFTAVYTLLAAGLRWRRREVTLCQNAESSC